jgi:phage terminase large subunit-like protein
MVRAIIHAVDGDIPYSEVHASRGKVVRAEPIATLYEMGKVFHIGHFRDLEDQMLAMNLGGYVGIKSPDRLDALVWGLTELFPKITKKKVDENFVHRPALTSSRSASRFDAVQHRR